MAAQDGQVSAAQRQLEELECMRSMFPSDDELAISGPSKLTLEEFVNDAKRAVEPPQHKCRIEYTLYFKDLPFAREVPSFTLTCPLCYPESEPMLFEVKCPHLSRGEMERLHAELVALTKAACANREVVALQMYQLMHDFVSQVQSGANMTDQREPGVAAPAEAIAPSIALGRRAIYFHHIIALNKRRVVKDWASELELGGFSKIGWPGIVIVEGNELNVQKYVRRLQQLSWKQMTVRGEQTEELSSDCFGGIDAMRRLPRTIHEFPENGMSDLAAACRAADLEELFLTTMKIYNRSGNNRLQDEDQNASLGTSGSKKKPSRAYTS